MAESATPKRLAAVTLDAARVEHVRAPELGINETPVHVPRLLAVAAPFVLAKVRYLIVVATEFVHTACVAIDAVPERSPFTVTALTVLTTSVCVLGV